VRIPIQGQAWSSARCSALGGLTLKESPRSERAMNPTSGLALMITATWVLLLAETFIFFGVVRPLAPNIHESMASAALKVGAIVGLLVVWGVAMFVMQTAYVRGVKRPPSPPA
jgi:hypothetical protein